jgi:hypothetical protein
MLLAWQIPYHYPPLPSAQWAPANCQDHGQYSSVSCQPAQHISHTVQMVGLLTAVRCCRCSIPPLVLLLLLLLLLLLVLWLEPTLRSMCLCILRY